MSKTAHDWAWCTHDLHIHGDDWGWKIVVATFILYCHYHETSIYIYMYAYIYIYSSWWAFYLLNHNHGCLYSYESWAWLWTEELNTILIVRGNYLRVSIIIVLCEHIVSNSEDNDMLDLLNEVEHKVLQGRVVTYFTTYLFLPHRMAHNLPHISKQCAEAKSPQHHQLDL